MCVNYFLLYFFDRMIVDIDNFLVLEVLIVFFIVYFYYFDVKIFEVCESVLLVVELFCEKRFGCK